MRIGGMRGKSRCNLAVYVAMCVVAFCAHSHALAAGTAFPSGGGDIASPTAWGLEELPTGEVEFPLGSDYSSSAAVSFSEVDLSGSSKASSVFDLSSGPVTITGGNNDADPSFQFLSSGLTARFKGGFLNAKANVWIGYATTAKNNTLIFDNCSLTNLSGVVRVAHGTGNHGNTLIFTNNATARLNALYINSTGGDSNYLEINPGCTVACAAFRTDEYGSREAADSSLTVVRGSGAKLSITGNLLIGYRHYNNVITVKDGATLDVGGSLQFGPGSGSPSGSSRSGYERLNVLNGATMSYNNLTLGNVSAENNVLISNATVTAGNATTVGYSADGGTNVLEVVGSETHYAAKRLLLGSAEQCDRNLAYIRDGAEITANSKTSIGIGGAFNEVIVSNANATLKGLVVGQESTGSNNVLRVCGPNVAFSYTLVTNDFFGLGSNGLVEFSDHCSVTSGMEPPVGTHSNDNVLRITGGASVTDSNLMLGRAETSSMAATSGNRVEILDGATYTLTYRPFVRGVGNGIVVSNASFYSSNSQTNNFLFGHVSSGELAEATSNNYLRLEGTSPLVRASSTGAGFRFWNRSRLEFALPATPYAQAPLKGSQLHIDDSSDFVFDFSALDAVQHGRMKFRLFEASTSNDGLKNLCSASAIARANASLAERGASLAWEGSGIGATLVLTVPGNYGMLMLLK